MTYAIELQCGGCGAPAGKRCLTSFCQERVCAAAARTREANRELKASGGLVARQDMELRELRAAARGALTALDLLFGAVAAGDVELCHYPWRDDNGNEHDCPEDDTCECQCGVVSEALSKAYRDLKRLEREGEGK